MLKRFCAFVMTLTLLCFSIVSVSAASLEDSTEDIYYVDASLSCYINAMGGVEFGAPLLQFTTVKMIFLCIVQVWKQRRQPHNGRYATFMELQQCLRPFLGFADIRLYNSAKRIVIGSQRHLYNTAGYAVYPSVQIKIAEYTV